MLTRRQFGLGVLAVLLTGCGGSSGSKQPVAKKSSAGPASGNLPLESGKHTDHVDLPGVDIVTYVPGNAYIDENKHLVLKMTNNPNPNGTEYLSGRVEYKNLNFRKGRIDIKAKLPAEKGLFPVIGLFPESDQWPPMVVIASSLGDRSLRTRQYRTAYDTTPTQTNDKFFPISKMTEEHTYSIEITDHEMIWYLDQKEVRREAKPPAFDTDWKIWLILRAGNAMKGIGDPDPGALDGSEMTITSITINGEIFTLV